MYISRTYPSKKLKLQKIYKTIEVLALEVKIDNV